MTGPVMIAYLLEAELTTADQTAIHIVVV